MELQMHIRAQGKSLQLLRATYDPTIKRGVQKLIARLPNNIISIPDDVKKLLTVEELAHLEDYLKMMDVVKTQQRQSENLNNIVETLLDATTALSTTNTIKETTIDSERAVEIYAALDAFSAALRKAGYTKPAKQKKEKPQT